MENSTVHDEHDAAPPRPCEMLLHIEYGDGREAQHRMIARHLYDDWVSFMPVDAPPSLYRRSTAALPQLVRSEATGEPDVHRCVSSLRVGDLPTIDLDFELRPEHIDDELAEHLQDELSAAQATMRFRRAPNGAAQIDYLRVDYPLETVLEALHDRDDEAQALVDDHDRHADERDRIGEELIDAAVARAAAVVRSAASRAGRATKRGAASAGRGVRRGARVTGGAVKRGTRATAGAAKRGATAVGGAAKRAGATVKSAATRARGAVTRKAQQTATSARTKGNQLRARTQQYRQRRQQRATLNRLSKSASGRASAQQRDRQQNLSALKAMAKQDQRKKAAAAKKAAAGEQKPAAAAAKQKAAPAQSKAAAAKQKPQAPAQQKQAAQRKQLPKRAAKPLPKTLVQKQSPAKQPQQAGGGPGLPGLAPGQGAAGGEPGGGEGAQGAAAAEGAEGGYGGSFYPPAVAPAEPDDAVPRRWAPSDVVVLPADFEPPLEELGPDSAPGADEAEGEEGEEGAGEEEQAITAQYDDAFYGEEDAAGTYDQDDYVGDEYDDEYDDDDEDPYAETELEASIEGLGETMTRGLYGYAPLVGGNEQRVTAALRELASGSCCDQPHMYLSDLAVLRLQQ